MSGVKKQGKKEQLDIDDHQLSLDQLCQRYGTSVNAAKPDFSLGLNQQQIFAARDAYGPNILSPPKKKHPFIRFLECLGGLFNLLLILAGILTFVLFFIDPKANLSSSYLGAILISVSILNALIEFIQLQKSANALESFLSMIPQQCRGVRDGALTQLAAADLVPGDIVFVRMGDKVPADLYLFNTSEMKVDNSSLTGESDPQARSVDNDQRNPLEASNLAFNGTLVVAGEGYGIVVRTGDSTVLGQIAGLTAGEVKNASPLSVEIGHFVHIIAAVATITAIIFVLLCIAQQRSAKETLTFAIGVFVAWVPEGLPATVTMLLTIAAKRMAGQNVLVKDLQGVETLGAITLLATDKTGTLTRNQMTVTNIWSCLNFYSSLRNLGNPGNPTQLDSPGLREVMLNATLNSRAKFDRTDVPVAQREVIGDATESGLLRFAAQNLPDFDALQSKYPRVFDIPFNSDNKWAMTISQVPHANGSLTLFLKGAPERVLRLCSTILVNGAAESLTEDHRKQFQETYETMASKGHRVLAFAQLQLDGGQYPNDFKFDKKLNNYPTSDLTFVGLASLEDPPKHGVREAIGRCRTAGIRVMMVTGDHPLTAEAIGRKINLMLSDTKEMVATRTGRSLESIREDEYDAVVIHGESIDSLSDREWDTIFSKNEIIFARTSPKHKLEIVKRAQSMGHIVGVTGDGVNDSPALKKADLGIAMNQSGSDVSKEAASMILLDDNFASTVRGIEEGRLIFTNLKKSIRYTVTHSIPEVIPQLLYIVVPMPLLINPLLILSIDLGFELCLALTYAWDQPETATGLMKLPPRKPVSEASVARFRRLKSRELPSAVDPESGEATPPSLVSRALHFFGRLFSGVYWRELFEKTDEEVVAGFIEVVTAYLAVYLFAGSQGISLYESYLMAGRGVFEEGNDVPYIRGALNLSPDRIAGLLRKFQTLFTLSIVITQAFNLFACKTRITYPFGRHMFTNYRNFVGLAVGFCLMAVVFFVPGVNVVFNTSAFPALYVGVPLIGGAALLLYSALRFFVGQRLRPTHFNREITGLQMHPTVQTVKAPTDLE
ncbi:hypothetical protein L0F63_004266 [Massospora cicadina]|nr:hypothetical protein L0F63_004266 [Massospora cicadina]